MPGITTMLSSEHRGRNSLGNLPHHLSLEIWKHREVRSKELLRRYWWRWLVELLIKSHIAKVTHTWTSVRSYTCITLRITTMAAELLTSTMASLVLTRWSSTMTVFLLTRTRAMV